mmetsp:Transcript_2185/g.6591  ORF Transcript_2185/g.6591 Transcript_2185/m.6591 type:complete len:247 (+) Transcript_2185:147-887(+)
MEPNEPTDLEQQLAILRLIEGVSGVFASEYVGPDLQRMNVQLKVLPRRSSTKKPIRVPCSGARPDKLACALEAKRRVREELGDAAVDAAERLFIERRAAAAAAASTSSAPLPATGHLMRTNQLAANLRAAQLRAQHAEEAATRAEAEATVVYQSAVREPLAAAKAAWLEVEAAAEEKARHTKQQRVEEPPAPAPAEPAWRKRPYAAYTSVDQWKKEEGANWNRRRVPLCGKPGHQKIDDEIRARCW